MKKILPGLLIFVLVTAAASAARLFDYRGVFPAERSSDARITNYMLLKKDTLVSFEIEEQGRGVSDRIIIPKIKLTSNEQIAVEKADGLKELVVPETGIYEITIMPLSAEPGEMRFILKVYENERPAPDTAPIQVLAPVETLPAAVMQASAPLDTAPQAPGSTIPIAATEITNVASAASATVATQTAAVVTGELPALLSPRQNEFLNPFNGFRFSYDDVNFLPDDKLDTMFKVFLRSADGSEIPVEAKRFSPEPDTLVILPEKVLPGAVYNVAIADENAATRKFFFIPALPEFSISMFQAENHVKAVISWNQIIDLLPAAAGQVQSLHNCHLTIGRGDSLLAAVEINETLAPVGALGSISYRAQPNEFEMTIPVDLVNNDVCFVEIKAVIDGNPEKVQIKRATFKPEIVLEPAVVEIGDASETAFATASEGNSLTEEDVDFSEYQAQENDTAMDKEDPSEDILALDFLPATATFLLEKSFSSVQNESDQLTAWPHDIIWGESGGIWVLDSQLRKVVQYTRQGGVVTSFGEKGGHTGAFGLPIAMALKNDKLYIADTMKRSIQVFALDGSPQGLIQGDAAIGGLLEQPSGISFRKNEMWLVDRSQAKILCFNDQGAFLGSFASTAAAPIISPVGIRADSDSLFILESNGLVKKFSPMGSFDATFQSGCNESTGFDLDPWGGIWVCDTSKFQVHRFARNGSILTTIKAPPGPKPWLPTAVSVRKDGRVAITDAQNKMVHIFTPAK